MFKDIKVQLTKILRSKWVPLVAFLGILIGLYVYSKDKYRITDRMTTGTNSVPSNENHNVVNPSMDGNIKSLDRVIMSTHPYIIVTYVGMDIYYGKTIV